MLSFLSGYRAKLGVISAILGGLTLVFNGLVDEASGTPGWTKIGAGLLGVGTGLVGAGIRWAPQFVTILEMLQEMKVSHQVLSAKVDRLVQDSPNPPGKT